MKLVWDGVVAAAEGVFSDDTKLAGTFYLMG
jgi:hypothetical protein